ncbi:hypothetical protein Poly51_57550 [Rubripirellula tenax]|uniref:Uncharacterized protein n=1 Tax=Rubripirellula tenax TaxID=2528015 RepID=A0A5C6EGJ0_9BACT|nr:hypothetical protein Poly51_57550 [Rubripirellula tenax]
MGFGVSTLTIRASGKIGRSIPVPARIISVDDPMLGGSLR